MATTQNLKDVSYDIALIKQQMDLREIFSDFILGIADGQGLNTYEEIITMTTFPVTVSSGLTDEDLKGVDHLVNITGLTLYINNLTEIDLSRLTSLQVVSMDTNQLTSIGKVNKLAQLNDIYLSGNPLTNGIGNISSLANITRLYLDSCSLSTDLVDRYLSQCKAAYIAGSSFSGGINLAGSSNGIPTNGASNSDYTYLVGEGVTVLIRV